jgi:hypothetical protein
MEAALSAADSAQPPAPADSSNRLKEWAPRPDMRNARKGVGDHCNAVKNPLANVNNLVPISGGSQISPNCDDELQPIIMYQSRQVILKLSASDCQFRLAQW